MTSYAQVPLGDLCAMDRRGLQPDDPTASRLRFVGVEHVEPNNGAVNFNGGSRIGSLRSTTFYFDDRHVLYSKLRPYLNKVATPNFVGRCSTELVPLLPRSGVDREFLAYLLRRKATVEYVIASVTGSRMPRTDMKALMCLPVPFPPLGEQRRIVGILNRAAEIERQRTQAAERLREFIPALFVKMFGDPSLNPMGWEVAPLGQLCTVSIGRTPRRSEPRYWGGPHPWATIRDLDGGTITATGEGITNTALDEVMPRAVEPGTLLFSFKLSIGTMGFAGRAMHHNEAIAALPVRDPDLLDRRFLFCALQVTTHEGTASHAVLGKMLNKRKVQQIEIPLPPIDEQRRFTELIEAAHAVTDFADLSSNAASTLSASLMDRLLNTSA